WLEDFQIPVNPVPHTWHRLDHLWVALPSPTMLVVESKSNGRPADPTQKCRPGSIRQIDHRVESPTAQPGDEPPLCRQRSFVKDHNLVHVRVPGQYVFRPAIYHHRDPDIRSCSFDGTDGRRRQQDVTDVAEFDDQEVTHVRESLTARTNRFTFLALNV